ncbi:MAG: hypothetical protein LBO72_10810 [Helicobacteraceae bacterium]|nr:hypothetical protein [Helicobacteraceae bacterium]
MRKTAFAIYILNLPLMAFMRPPYLFETPLIVIALCIGAFALKNICKDECLATHFAYQFKTNLVASIYLAVVICCLFFFPYETIKDRVLPSMLAGAGVYIISILMLLWFFYRNVKGLIYLSKNEVL